MNEPARDETEEEYEDDDEESDEELDCPIEINPNVEEKVNEYWKTLKRVAISRFENGKQTRIHSFNIKWAKGATEPTDHIDEVIDEIHREGMLQSKREGREINCKVQFFSNKGDTNAPYIFFRACYPGVKSGPDLTSIVDADTSIANVNAQSNAVALQMVMTIVQKVLDREDMLIDRVDRAHNREHTLLLNLANNQNATVERERLANETLNTAIHGLVENSKVRAQLEVAKATVDSEIQKGINKHASRVSLFESLGSGFKELLPTLKGLALVHAGADAESLPGLLSALEGKPSGTSVPTDEPPPPPPPSPSASTRVTAEPTLSYYAGRAGLLMTQEHTLYEQLTAEQIARLKAWLKPNQSDDMVIGALLQITGAPDGQHIVRTLISICTEEQGLLLDQCLTEVFKKSGKERPTPPVTVEPEAEPEPEEEKPKTKRRTKAR